MPTDWVVVGTLRHKLRRHQNGMSDACIASQPDHQNPDHEAVLATYVYAETKQCMNDGERLTQVAARFQILIRSKGCRT